MNLSRNHLRSAVSIVFALVFASCSSPSPEDAAERAARAWLETVDSGQYRASWSQGAGLFQHSLSASQWEQSLRSARGSFGAVKSRTLKSAQYTTTLPGAPEGEYVVLRFETRFDRRDLATETVTPMLENGAWKVSGYYIQ